MNDVFLFVFVFFNVSISSGFVAVSKGLFAPANFLIDVMRVVMIHK